MTTPKSQWPLRCTLFRLSASFFFSMTIDLGRNHIYLCIFLALVLVWLHIFTFPTAMFPTWCIFNLTVPPTPRQWLIPRCCRRIGWRGRRRRRCCCCRGRSYCGCCCRCCRGVSKTQQKCISVKETFTLRLKTLYITFKNTSSAGGEFRTWKVPFWDRAVAFGDSFCIYGRNSSI